MSEAEVIDVEVEEIGQELVRHQGGEVANQSNTLFGTDDPALVVERASAIAKVLADMIAKQGLFTKIQGKNHVRVEGWTTLGSMLGVFPVLESCDPVEIDGVKGFRAIVNAQTRSGEIVGRAEAYCMKNENRWSSAELYAVASMAQTRAVSKALRLPLGFVVQLAGYETTPAEELSGGQSAPADSPRPFDPTKDLLKDAPEPKSGWAGILKDLTDIDRSIDWGPVMAQAIMHVYGVETKDLKGKPKTEAWFRTANATTRISERFAKETFLSLDSIQESFAEMFNGIIVSVPEFDESTAALAEEAELDEAYESDVLKDV
jgi:hypothetical protein